MKRIYVIVPKKLRTKPPVTVGCGFAMAQIHHATVKAAKRFKLDHRAAVIVLEVPNTTALERLSLDLTTARIKFDAYWEQSDRFHGTAMTALVTNMQTKKLKQLSKLKLWSC